MRTATKSLLVKLGIAAVSIVISLVVIEIVFRVAGIHGEYHNPRVDREWVNPNVPREREPYGWIPLARVESQYNSDPRGYFEPGNIVNHRHNSVGWRDTEHTIKKPPGTFRILGLGDSYLWGQGVRFEDICLKKLESILAEAMPRLTIETINGGISAYNTTDQRDQLLHRGLQYDPNLVIVHFVLNDVEIAEDLQKPGPKIEFFRWYTHRYMVADVVSNYSYLWSWVRQRYLQQIQSRTYIKQCLATFTADSPKWNRCRKSLDDIDRICRDKNVALLIVIFPFFHNLDGDYPFQFIHDTVREHCLSKQIPVLDLRDHYRDYRGPELWVHPTDQHPNEKAHDIAARTIADYLTNNSAILLTKRDHDSHKAERKR